MQTTKLVVMQFFEFTSSGELRLMYLSEQCAAVGDGGKLTFSDCTSDVGIKSLSQLWKWNGVSIL